MLFRRLMARKSLENLMAEMSGEHRLHRVLGPISLTSLGVGAIIGAGIFVMTGRAAAVDAGPAIIVSYAVAALGCTLAAFCYAEFASMAPVAGSAYTYAYATIGEVFAWIIGWDLILEYAMACACVAAGWSEYLDVFLQTCFGWHLDPRFMTNCFSDPNAWFNLPAVLVMVAVTIVLILGIRESALVNAILVLVKLFVVLFVIGLGLRFVTPTNWTSVPVSERLGPEIAELTRLAREASNNPAESTALANHAIAEFRVKRQSEEGRRLLDRKAMSPDAFRQTMEEVENRYASLRPQTPEEKAKVAALFERLETKRAAMSVQKWGILGMIGLDRWLIPLDDSVRSPFAPYGVSGIMLGAAIVFFAFIGFDSISTHSEEAKNPARDVPISILASLAICTLLYVAVAAVITGMDRYPDIDQKAAIAHAFKKQADELQAAGHPSGLVRASSALIATGALAGLTSVLLVTFLSQARVFLAMARDKLLPPSIFAAIHPRFKTPHISTALTGGVICLVAAFTPIEKLEEMVNIGTLMAFVIVCVSVLLLRIRRPDAERPFRCPALFFVAPMGIVVNVTMMLFLPWDTWLRLLLWLALGMVIYFTYGYRHSILGESLWRELREQGIGPTDAPLRP